MPEIETTSKPSLKLTHNIKVGMWVADVRRAVDFWQCPEVPSESGKGYYPQVEKGPLFPEEIL